MKSAGVVELGDLRFDPASRELRDAEGQLVDLRRQSADVLAELASRPHRTLSKDELIAAIWPDVAVTDGSLAQCIADIRRTLGAEGRDCIRTVPRRGYRLEPTGPGGSPGTWSGRRSRLRAALALIVVAAVVAGLFLREAGTPAVLPPDAPTIVVLPFENMSGDSEQLYFSDGLTEDLTTDLSRVSGLRMISRASSFSYRDSDLAPRDIALDLGATHYVTGSVRRDGRRIRINATLSEAASGANIWADRYDRDIGGIFELQDEVTRAIATTLAIELTVSEERRLDGQQTVDPDAYDLLLRGLAPFRSFSREGTVAARAFFRRAIEIDPGYARAHANLALSYARSVIFRLEDDPEAVKIALAEAETAAALGPSVPQVHFALAVVHLAARNHDSAVDAARQAVLLDPNYADGYAVLAQTLAYSGDAEAGLPAIRTAKTLSPRYVFDYLWVEGNILFQERRYAEAREVLEEVVARNPAFLVGRLTLAATYGHLGETEEVAWLAVEILTMAPGLSAAAEGARAPYRREADRRHYVQGLLLAGLPE